MAEQFKVGDKVVYPSQGVVEVIDNKVMDIGGHSQRFYILRVLDTDRKVMVPVDNAATVGMRATMSEPEIVAVFETLRDRGDKLFKGQTWHKRYKGYQEMIKTGEIHSIAQVLRDLLLTKAGGRQLSFAERRTLDSVRKTISQEVAISREVSEAEVVTEIEALFAAA